MVHNNCGFIVGQGHQHKHLLSLLCGCTTRFWSWRIMVWRGLSSYEVLAYGNMCHLNSLRAAFKELPLPVPFNKMWQSVEKIIDRLHWQNHKGPYCKIHYSPDSILSESFNTMAAEQVNVWASGHAIHTPHVFLSLNGKEKKYIHPVMLQGWETAYCIKICKEVVQVCLMLYIWKYSNDDFNTLIPVMQVNIMIRHS